MATDRRRTDVKPVAVRSSSLVLAALAFGAAVTVGCAAVPSAAPPPIPSPSSTIIGGVDLDGLVTAIGHDGPVTLDCFPSGSPDPAALCPPEGDEVLGSVTIDGTLVLVTEATEVQTCGPNDGPVEIAFEDADGLLNHVTPLIASAKVQALPSGPSPGWARASSVFLGSCG
jgi:hypothetical protein